MSYSRATSNPFIFLVMAVLMLLLGVVWQADLPLHQKIIFTILDIALIFAATFFAALMEWLKEEEWKKEVADSRRGEAPASDTPQTFVDKALVNSSYFNASSKSPMHPASGIRMIVMPSKSLCRTLSLML